MPTLEHEGEPKPEGELVIAEYTDADDAACKELEISASQFTGLGGLIKAAIHHHGTFDAKPRLFDDHVVLTAKWSGEVCGVVAVGIKDMYVHGRERRCGFVFDLRVGALFQRRGIGAALTTALEARCKEWHGVDFLYLSANNTNSKARSLYSKQGWSKASRRALSS